MDIHQRQEEDPKGLFGSEVSSYEMGRKKYPEEVYYLLSTCLLKESSILELGCGTGIATKQLYQMGFTSLLATDVDPIMLGKAQELCPEVHFQLADAHLLSFPSSSFDAVVAFGCFHWFCDTQAIEEIKRVMKSHGLFFVANKNDRSSFRQEFHDFLRQLDRASMQEPKANYEPIEKLSSHGFTVSCHIFHAKEWFTYAELLDYCQSISLWASLSAEKKKQYLPALQAFVERRMHRPLFERDIEVRCLVATLGTL
jgi:ubiquinone/menaquinone biosynthesis C-methylase UbiE